MRNTTALSLRSARSYLLVLGVLAALCGSSFFAAKALAATNHYCNSCQLYTYKSGVTNYIYRSYVNYLGSGDRLLGVGTLDYASMKYDWNEVWKDYAGTHFIRPSSENQSTYTYVTVNAHGSY